MEKKFDYNEFDKIVVTTKREKVENIIKDYAVFGWQELTVDDDEVFYDVIHITFFRAHVMDNKDELLYLQVCYEQRLNKASDLERYKYTYSSIFYCILLIFSIITLILGVISIVKFSNVLVGLLFIVACFMIGGAVVPVNKIRKKEYGLFITKYNNVLKEIEEILIQAKALSGVYDEEQKN